MALVANSGNSSGKVTAQVDRDGMLTWRQAREDLRLSLGRSTVHQFLKNFHEELVSGGGTFSTADELIDSLLLISLMEKLLKEKKREFASLGQEMRLLACLAPKKNDDQRVVFKDLTLLQVACATNASALVVKYLEQGVDVNQAVGASHTGEYAGRSPLHLALSELKASTNDKEIFSTVRALLSYGADVNSRDSRGNTPLHVLFSRGSFDEHLWQLTMKYGADSRITNHRGQTPFEILLITQPLLDVKKYLRIGGRINFFNSLDKTGCVAMLMLTHRIAAEDIVDFLNVMQSDEQGRTAIHNVVSFNVIGKSAKFIESHYNNLKTVIECLLNKGGTIDCQDNLGRTPLHYAVGFHNKWTICLLLTLGADLNAIDVDGKSALSLSLDFLNSKITPVQMKENKKIIKYIISHLHKLAVSGFYISKYNKLMLLKTCVKYKMGNKPIEKFCLEIDNF